MEYVFGTVRRNGEDRENLKTVGDKPTDLKGRVVIRREYDDRIIEDSFYIVDHYASKESAGEYYDWYLIDKHDRDTDMFSPVKDGINERMDVTEQEITDTEIAQMEQEQMITDHDIAIMELWEKIEPDA